MTFDRSSHTTNSSGRTAAGRDARVTPRSWASIPSHWVAMVSALVLALAVLASGPASAAAPAPSAAASPALNGSGGPGPSATSQGPVKTRPPTGVVAPAAGDAAPDAHVFHALTRLDGFTDGGFGSFTVARPLLSAADSHSLAELSVESGISNDIVEVGWTVDRIVNGDDLPHLFVFHWVAGKPIGYNGQGFVQTAASGGPGTLLVTGSVHKFMIQHYQGNWWIGDNDWIGYYPDSLWPHRDAEGKVDGSTFTQGFRVQWFGEVYAHTVSPCSQMGNGHLASFAGAAHIDQIGEFNGPVVRVNALADHPDIYTATANGPRGIRFGGPGACVPPPPVAVPDLVFRTTSAAQRAITSAGLRTGVMTPEDDLVCDDAGKVIRQSPAARTMVRAGSVVNFSYAVPPADGPCPVIE